MPSRSWNHLQVSCIQILLTLLRFYYVKISSFSETGNGTFTGETDCRYTNGYHFDTALMLSIFLGMFGADRFYLGYPALGLLKFSTLGFFFLGHLLDIILIASQVVKPADESDYIISYYGAGLQIITSNQETAKLPQSDWF